MKIVVGRSVKRPNSKTISLIAAIILAMPISASVICISPDGHVAIENLNADCCATLDLPGYEKHSQDVAFRAHDECLNCTDLPLLSKAPCTIQRGYSFSAAGAFADECGRKILETCATSRSLPQKEYAEFLLSPPASSSVPLRC